ncbi:HAAS signaling domain-containing protein [Streptomyces litmocidini]|uniref:HAAS signaling domain-containing protein n=1 Tax=Streptomyces litmocidini TaxID=67318 RepID=UPI0037022D28
MTGTAHPLVTDYLAAIEREASFLPAGRREELLADLREHLAVAIGEEQDPEAVRTALERLGSPSAIVAAAREEEPEAAAAAPSPAPQPRSRSVLTAVLLGVSGIAALSSPFAGLAALVLGLALLWTSAAWQRRTKAVATALTLAAPVTVGLSMLLLAARLGIVELLVLLAVSIALPATAAVRLLRAPARAA